jgi:ubiquinone biosynthesis O-methyltransferase
MNKKELESIDINLKKIKKSLPYLEKLISKRSVKKIENSANYMIYLLHRISKKATGKGTEESIEDIKKTIWWFKMQKRNKDKYVTIHKQYSVWAKNYDKEINLPVFLEEKVSGKFFERVKGKDILDYGCGTGRYCIPLAKREANVTAIDFNSAMLKIAKEKAKKSKLKINFKKQDITEYKPDKKFDLIISMLVLDHIKNLKKVVEVINKVSKIGTKVVISNIHPEMIRNLYNQTGKVEGYLIKGYKTDRYYHPLEEYVELFLEKGFILTKIKDIIYDKQSQQIKKFKKFGILKDKAVTIIMKFEKIKDEL